MGDIRWLDSARRGDGADRSPGVRRGTARPQRGHVPTRTPRGEEVRWWERPMPPGTRDAEAWEMCRELMRVLHATGRYSATGLSEACGAIGRPHARETISRVLNGKQPPSYGLVEDLALAAGVDLAFLYPAA